MALLGKWFGFGREELYEQAIDAYEIGDWECAIERFEAVLDGSSDLAINRLANFYLADSYAQLGLRFLRDGDSIDGVMNLLKAVDIAPDYPDLHVALARGFRKIGDNAGREAALRQALRINSRYVDAILEEGILRYELGKRQEGLDQVRQAVLVEPSYDSNALSEAVEADAKGDVKRATAALQLVSGGRDREIVIRLAEIFLRDRMFEEAAAEFARALQAHPHYADLRFKYGVCLLELGHPEEAAAAFKAALLINPQYVEAQALLTRCAEVTEDRVEATQSSRPAPLPGLRSA